MTELEAVNKILRYVGELPVPSSVIIDDLPDGHEAKTALEILTEVNKELQEPGWWFNLEKWSYPPVDGYITFPTTVISIKSTNTKDKYLVKGNQLYDVANQTKIFTTDVELTTVFEVGFEDLPSVFASLVVYEASKQLHIYLNGDITTLQNLEKLIYTQYIKVQKEHMSYKDYNLISGTGLIDRGTNPMPII